MYVTYLDNEISTQILHNTFDSMQFINPAAKYPIQAIQEIQAELTM